MAGRKLKLTPELAEKIANYISKEGKRWRRNRLVPVLKIRR